MITYTDQNVRPLEIEDKVNLSLLINKQKQHNITFKGYGFLSFARKNKKQLLNIGLNASEKVVHEAGKLIGNKIVDTVTKSNNDNIEKQEPVEEILIPLEKRE